MTAEGEDVQFWKDQWRCCRCDELTSWSESIGMRRCRVRSHNKGVVVKRDLKRGETTMWGCCEMDASDSQNDRKGCSICDHTPDIIQTNPSIEVPLWIIKSGIVTNALKDKFIDTVVVRNQNNEIDDRASYYIVRLYDQK